MTTLAEFVVRSAPPQSARVAAARAFLDTIGVTLAGSGEPAARIVQQVVAGGDSGSAILGTSLRADPGSAALANGTAAHALDYDDMCFVSLAHPSAPLVTAALAVGEAAGAPGEALLDAYVAGFEIEGRLGRAMNPSHYERGWHCTSTLGTIGAAAAASRLLGLDVEQTGHALAIAASEACGLKENFGTMVKPLHAGLAARNGVLAAQFARAGMVASPNAVTGAQGFMAAMDGRRSGVALHAVTGDLGSRWEIVDTGITVKLYPSCAATHPMLDVLLALRREHRFGADDVGAIEIGVDAITPTVLIYDTPSNGLQAKFSMPYCAAAAVIDGGVGIETFDDARVRKPDIEPVRSRVAMRVDATLNSAAPPLTQVRVRLTMRGGPALSGSADGARGYPDRPASDDELSAKFLSCASRALPRGAAERALHAARALADAHDIRTVVGMLRSGEAV